MPGNPLQCYTGFPLFRNEQIPWFFHDISRFFSQISRYSFLLFFNIANITFDSLISLAGGENFFKSTELWFSFGEKSSKVSSVLVE